MNIIEAVKSGKRFRRKGNDGYLNPDHAHFLTKEDLLADYEIEEKIELSRESAKEIFKNLNNLHNVDEFLYNLGFGK